MFDLCETAISLSPSLSPLHLRRLFIPLSQKLGWSYEGEVNSEFQPHGKGKLFQKKQLLYKGIFHEGRAAAWDLLRQVKDGSKTLTWLSRFGGGHFSQNAILSMAVKGECPSLPVPASPFSWLANPQTPFHLLHTAQCKRGDGEYTHRKKFRDACDIYSEFRRKIPAHKSSWTPCSSRLDLTDELKHRIIATYNHHFIRHMNFFFIRTPSLQEIIGNHYRLCTEFGIISCSEGLRIKKTFHID